MPSGSLCMENQARGLAGTTVTSASTCNFPNRLGDSENVYLVTGELTSISGKTTGYLRTTTKYLENTSQINSMSDKIYRYLNFDQIESFQSAAEKGKLIAAQQIVELLGWEF